MTEYYVRATGDDGNGGTSPTDAWQTVNHGINNIAAGDVLWVGAGIYKEQVTVTAGGNAGNPKVVRGDFDGLETGDAGLVIITAHDYVNQPTARNYCIDLNEQEFLEFYDLVLVGGEIAAFGDADAIADWSLEGVEFHRCVIAGGDASDDHAMSVDINDGDTPATSGLVLNQCIIVGQGIVTCTRNAVQHYNLKWQITNCIALSSRVISLVATGADAFSPNGITIEHCTLCTDGLADQSVYHQGITNATNQTLITECLVLGENVAYESGCANDTIGVYNSRTAQGNLGLGDIEDIGLNIVQLPTPLLAGFADVMWRGDWKWSPWQAWVSMCPNYLMSNGVTAGMLSQDMLDRPRPMGEDCVWQYYLTDDDQAVTDPDAAWTNDANVYNGSLANSGYTGTQGDAGSNYILGGGSLAPAVSGRVNQVRGRFYARGEHGGEGATVRFYSDGLVDTLGTVSLVTAVAAGWSEWVDLSEPAGGWGNLEDELQTIEAKVWKSNAVAGNVYVYAIELEATVRGGEDIGPVQSRARAHRETVVVPGGLSNSGRLEGAGIVDLQRPVLAEETTFRVKMRYDGNYAGNLPRMQVFNIPDGVADGEDVMIGAADTWEELEVTFTPTEDGWCVMRVESRDTSGDGIMYFGDIE